MLEDISTVKLLRPRAKGDKSLRGAVAEAPPTSQDQTNRKRNGAQAFNGQTDIVDLQIDLVSRSTVNCQTFHFKRPSFL